MNLRTWKLTQGRRREDAAIRAMCWIMTALLIGAVLAMIFVPRAQADELTTTPHLTSPTEGRGMIGRGEDANAWTAGDTALQSVFLMALAVDRGQTDYASNKPQYIEVGWARNFIGPHPSSSQVNRYFATCAVVHTAVAYILPKPYRTIWQSFFIGVEMSTIDTNVNAGISVRF